MIRSRGEYKFVTGANVDESGSSDFNRIIVNGSIMPLRKGKAKREVRGEDITFLVEAATERIVAKEVAAETFAFDRQITAEQFNRVVDRVRNAQVSNGSLCNWLKAAPTETGWSTPPSRSMNGICKLVDLEQTFDPYYEVRSGSPLLMKPVEAMFKNIGKMTMFDVDKGSVPLRSPRSIFSGSVIPQRRDEWNLGVGQFRSLYYSAYRERPDDAPIIDMDFGVTAESGSYLWSRTVSPNWIGLSLDMWCLIRIGQTTIRDSGTTTKRYYLLCRAYGPWTIYDTANIAGVAAGMISGRWSQMLSAAGIQQHRISSGENSCTDGIVISVDDVFPILKMSDRTVW